MKPLTLLLVGLPRVALPPLGRWIRIARERRHLARLDDRVLQDIGITREQALTESSRPFWDLPG